MPSLTVIPGGDMRVFGIWTVARMAARAGAVTAGLTFSAPSAVHASEIGPFGPVAGWWGGQGRLRFKDGKQEQVKCRTTYFVSGDGSDLKQTIRCASGSGKIEVTSL